VRSGDLRVSHVKVDLSGIRAGYAAITDIRIARVETTAMIATEYADALEALAVLIARYECEHPEQPTAE
jgi:hypothetical protein